MLHRVMEYLGLATPPVVEGFRRSDYGDRRPICQSCGVQVAFEGQQLHLDWHARRGDR